MRALHVECMRVNVRVRVCECESVHSFVCFICSGSRIAHSWSLLAYILAYPNILQHSQPEIAAKVCTTFAFCSTCLALTHTYTHTQRESEVSQSEYDVCVACMCGSEFYSSQHAIVRVAYKRVPVALLHTISCSLSPLTPPTLSLCLSLYDASLLIRRVHFKLYVPQCRHSQDFYQSFLMSKFFRLGKSVEAFSFVPLMYVYSSWDHCSVFIDFISR